MESLFFNTPSQHYQVSEIFQNSTEYLRKVDISNGIFFYDACLKKYQQSISFKNLDRMVMIVVIKGGRLEIENHRNEKKQRLKENMLLMYCSSRQDFTLHINGEVFILFIADFFLKHYLTFSRNEPIDFLYEKVQKEVLLDEIHRQPIDALSLYLIEKIIHTKEDKNMRSLRCMHHVIEFITHRFSLIDLLDESIGKEELALGSRARNHLLNSFVTPPSIERLAHLCATNESKLKKVFKKVYKITIYSYVQQLRLEEANLLLREKLMTIGEVSKRVGYKHQGHFSKLFFETYAVYPRDLLKK